MEPLPVIFDGPGSVTGHFSASQLQLWRTIMDNKWLLDTLEEGYCLQFRHHYSIIHTYLAHSGFGASSSSFSIYRGPEATGKGCDRVSKPPNPPGGGGISFKLLPHLKQDSKYQYRVLHFDLSLSPSVFTQCVQVALEPLQWEGMLILPYLDDWLLCA